MTVRARTRERVRRAFPYIVIAAVGFAIAYVVVFVFILPSRVVTPKPKPYVRDTALQPLPIETGVNDAPQDNYAPVGAYTPPLAPIPVSLPDLTGMLLPDARSITNSLHLDVIVTYDTSSTDTPNTVIRQSPPSGVKVPDRAKVSVVVAKAPDNAPDTSVSTDSTIKVSQPIPKATPAPMPKRPLPPIRPGSASDTMP